jgi:N-acylneuraminate cytidylyltransferase
MATAWAIIPARGGSKGVPEKNLQLVGGRSLVSRAISACVAAEFVDRVIVSTDDPRIKGEALACGAEVIDRPAELAGDDSSSESAILHALGEISPNRAELPEVTLLVQCTSPFTRSSDLDALVRLIKDHDCVFTATRSHVFLWRRSSDSMVGINHNPSRRLPRQYLETEFAESGNAYAMRTSGFLEHQHRFFGSIGLHEIDPFDSLEIDSPTDLALARSIASGTSQAPHASALRQVEAVIFDFDGVLTDDTVVVHEDGSEAVTAHRGDGLGIAALRDNEIAVLILSKERNPVVSARARKLQVDVIQGCDDKRPAVTEWLEQQGIHESRALFVGNDVNDLDAMASVGLAACPSDARPEVLATAHWVLTPPGGRGAARELCDAIVHARCG